MKLMPVIWVEGIIAAGKTTLAKELATRLNMRPYLEPVETNPYLEVFYQDPKRWAYAMQTYLLAHRYAMQQSASYEPLVSDFNGAVLDRGLPGDRVFCKMHHTSGNVTDLEWQTYDYFYNVMAATVRVPSLIVFLDVEPEIAMERLQRRGRDAERSVTLDYLQKLRAGYMDLLVEVESGRHAWAQGMQTIRIPWNTDHQSIEPIVEEIQRRFSIPDVNTTLSSASKSITTLERSERAIVAPPSQPSL